MVVGHDPRPTGGAGAGPAGFPEEFATAVRDMRAAVLRPEVSTDQMPAPQRIAPYASALSGDVVVDGEEIGTGRIVLLHDPAGNDAWDGTFRCVAYVRADLEPEQAGDPVLPEVAWTWLTEALAAHGADFHAASGTVTCVTSDSFGAMADEERSAQVEIRASWTPAPDQLGRHVEAWGELLCTAAGLPPVPEGVAVMGRGATGCVALRTPVDDTPDGGNGTGEATEALQTPQAELLVLRDGLPAVVEDDAALAAACAALAAGSGPVAVDAERASGYRYSARAYLVQLRREGAGTFLVDPIAFDDLAPLQEAIDGVEWILHAATQDLACLREVGLRPASLFDTELAGRLLGYPRVGLATLTEDLLGRRMRKEHSAQDWSRRPLPEPWLEYAALDVEALAELREVLVAQLAEAGKTEWARQEFTALLDHAPAVRVDPWRRTSGMHKVRGRRGLAAVRALWTLRDELAAQRDVTPSRLIPDSAIVAAAQAMPGDRRALMATSGFHGRGAQRYAGRWVEAIREASELPEADLPPRSPRLDGPPLPRAWAERDPVAARRLTHARAALAEMAERLVLPVENLMTPDVVRRVLWEPPATREPEALAAATADAVRALGARQWQADLVVPVLVDAVLAADRPQPEPDPEGPDAEGTTGSA